MAYLEFGHRERRFYRLMLDYWVYDSRSRLLEDFGDTIRRQSGAWNAVLEAVEAYAETDESGDSMTAAHLTWASFRSKRHASSSWGAISGS